MAVLLVSRGVDLELGYAVDQHHSNAGRFMEYAGYNDIQDALVPAPLFSSAEWDEMIESLKLSPQQGRIVELILEGKSDKEIAADMQLHFSTVRTYLSRLFARYQAHDRTQLVLRVFGHFRHTCRNKGCPRGCQSLTAQLPTA